MAAPVQYNDQANFPLGARIYGVSIVPETTGRILFVDSTNTANKGDDTNHGNTPQAPFATIDFAIGQCTASRGDIIKVLPGHTETLTAAGAINLDVAGVTIEGLGEGRSRPTITLASAVTASIDFNAASCILKNIVIDMTGIDNIGQGGGSAGGIRLLAADCVVMNCELIIATTGNQVRNAIGASTSAHRSKVINNLIAGSATAGPLSAINVSGAGAITVDGLEISYNRIIGDFSTAAININMTDIARNFFIHDNTIIASGSNEPSLIIVVGAGSSGIVAYNQMAGTNLTNIYSPGLVDAKGFVNVENYGYDIDTSGLLGVPLPIVGTQLPANVSTLDQILGQEFSFLQANYLVVTADFSSATWNTIGTHEILTVPAQGLRIIIVPEIVTTLTSGGAATLSLGEEAAGTSIIGATAVAALTAGKFWLTATPAAAFAKTSVIDRIVHTLDIGFAVAAFAFTGGRIDFHIWTVPVTNNGIGSVGAGGAL